MVFIHGYCSVHISFPREFLFLTLCVVTACAGLNEDRCRLTCLEVREALEGAHVRPDAHAQHTVIVWAWA